MKLFVDMDGVLCNFSKSFSELHSIKVGDVSSYIKSHDDAWDRVNKAGASYWSDMEWNPGGMELWEAVKGLNPTILTSPIEDDSCYEGKRRWVDRNISKDQHIIFESKKFLYAKEEGILIDDMAKNIDPWIEAGGIGILHTSTEKTLKELNDYLMSKLVLGDINDITNQVSVLKVKGSTREASPLNVISKHIECKAVTQ